MHFHYQALKTVLQKYKKTLLSSLKATIHLLFLEIGRI